MHKSTWGTSLVIINVDVIPDTFHRRSQLIPPKQVRVAYLHQNSIPGLHCSPLHGNPTRGVRRGRRRRGRRLRGNESLRVAGELRRGGAGGGFGAACTRSGAQGREVPCRGPPYRRAPSPGTPRRTASARRVVLSSSRRCSRRGGRAWAPRIAARAGGHPRRGPLSERVCGLRVDFKIIRGVSCKISWEGFWIAGWFPKSRRVFSKNDHGSPDLGRPRGRSDGHEKPATWTAWLRELATTNHTF